MEVGHGGVGAHSLPKMFTKCAEMFTNCPKMFAKMYTNCAKWGCGGAEVREGVRRCGGAGVRRRWGAGVRRCGGAAVRRHWGVRVGVGEGLREQWRAKRTTITHKKRAHPE